MSAVAARAGIPRESLYRALSLRVPVGLKPPRFTSLSAARKSLDPALPAGFFLAWDGGYTVQNPVLVATQWLHEPKREKVCY